jgi:hypothetical protein
VKRIDRFRDEQHADHDERDVFQAHWRILRPKRCSLFSAGTKVLSLT